ncbi:DegT/DnrJ/EryC1/StrS aminotransferase [Amycolatopsis acidicola]|uniref:DegT/DnrJ/EryC1/StrS aminotransferase n=1 Tax=Amycolatopsis acidicola TaxID=2596893 RepID=A0A5N0VFQ5_9PSEU|nr:DegT/DnrJ/EryC1/StrS family aminotransferase [Amycolatopsis acidicola]KAA9164945.1 DegT/DnrJ/EryC1/StrS aminotransferase [Amycolatopsis acidicola]
MIPLIIPALFGREAAYLRQCVETNYVSSAGPFVTRFEQVFADRTGSRHAVACSSGTAALHVALQLAGAGPGVLVAVSDFTFIASANAISYTGADLLLVDSEPVTWNMNTELLHDEISRRARLGERIPGLIEVVHVLGHPADMEPLLAIREEYGIGIVEDAAESFAASWLEGRCRGRQVGTVGEIGCFSFNGNKLITTGGGGMLVSDSPEHATAARHLTNQAKKSDHEYQHDVVGYNYRLSNIAAALGVAQLENLDDILRKKRDQADLYAEELRPLPVTLPPNASWATPTFWLYSILLDEARPDHVIAQLLDAQIQTRRLWPPLHRQAPYASTERLGGGVADDIYARGLSLPSTTGLSTDDQRRVATELQKILS